MARLQGLKLDEFSIVCGDDLKPANPEAKISIFKAEKKGESTMAQAAKPPERRKSLAAVIGEAVNKAVSTFTSQSTYESTSTTQETFDDGTSGAEPGNAAAAGTEAPPMVIVVTDSVAKTAAAPAEPTTPAAAPAGSDGAALMDQLAKALDPITKGLGTLNARITAIEKTSTGSRVIKAAPTGVFSSAEVRSNTPGEGFSEFAKFLEAKAGLTPGQRLTKAVLTSAGWSYGLSVAEAGTFIDYIFDQSVLLKQCRRVNMPNVKYVIDKIAFGGKVLVKSTPGTDPGDTVTVSSPTQVALNATEVKAIISVGDDTLEDNIEGAALVDHLMGMISRAASNELEQAAIHGDTSVADTGILDRWDGWYKLAKANGAHVIEGMADTDRYWPGTDGTKATKILKSIPVKYRQDFRNLVCILANDTYLDFNDMLGSKGFSEAWQAITGMTDLPIRSVRNVRTPMLSTTMNFSYSSTPYTDGTFVMFTDVRNLIFGVHRDIKIEPQRNARKGCTDYVLTMRAAANIENGDAIGIYDHAKVKP